MGTLFINSNFAILKWDFAHGFQIFIQYTTNAIIGHYHGDCAFGIIQIISTLNTLQSA